MKKISLSLLVFVCIACGSDSKDSKGEPTELEGTWTSACVLSFKTLAIFEGKTFKINFLTHDDASCANVLGTSLINGGTFVLGGAAAEPADSKDLDLKGSNGNVFTVYKLSGSTLDFTIQNDDDDAHDGSTDAKRINVLSGSPMTRI